MRNKHYLKKQRTGQMPNNCIWVDTETKSVRIDSKTVQAKLWFGWACYSRRKSNKKWTKLQWRKFYHEADFWIECDFKSRAKSKLYIIAHNQAFDFTVMRGWHYLSAMGWKCEKAIIEAPPTIIKWTRDNRTIVIIDTLNYFRVSLKQLGEDIGMSKLRMPDEKSSHRRWDAYCRRDTKVIHKAFMQYMKFIIDNDLGSFQVTLASQALSIYRYKFMSHDILIDDNHDALNLARESYKGGRTECWFVGDINHTTHLVDFNSMYPAIMQCEEMPSRLISYCKNVSHAELKRWLVKYCVIADVDIQTDENCYAVRQDKKLIFPVGRFNVSLCTPELQYALENKHIVKIHKVALYEKDIIFGEYVKWMYFARRSFIESGNTAFAYICKILLNSLYGKFGQSGYIFNEISQTDSTEIKTWTEIDAVNGSTYNLRQFGGLIQELQREGESEQSSPAIAAHVTAHGRMNLYLAAQQAGFDQVYYMDTDSLLVSDRGLAQLTNMMHQTELGKLALESTYKDVTLYSSKDYRMGKKVKIKGIRKDAEHIDVNTFKQQTFVSFKGMLQSGDLDKMIIRDTTKHLSRRYSKGTVNSDGTVKPLILDLV